ncbi:MAG: polysaccharide biosynthesis tyrosine autokinase [Deltaproteobacteria bacterium]|nr:polysaccharide biosynthesis tyrosine autokinase [Deltaproteobacteria bacterium]
MSDGIGLADCWRIIRRYRRLIVTLLSVALLLTGVVVFLSERNFTASAIVLIEPEPPQVLDIRELISESGSTDDHDYYKTQYDLLKSRDLAAGVIRELNLESTELLGSTGSAGFVAKIWAIFARFFNSTQELAAAPETDGVRSSAIDAYLGRLTIEPLIGTRLVKVSFSAPDPRLAARIANAHVRHFVQQGIQLRSESRRAAVEFLENQLVQIRQRVQQSEAALNTYRHQKGIVAFDVEDTNKISQGRMEDLTRALTEAETKRINAESQMQQVKNGDYDSLPQVIANPAITVLKPQVRNLQAEYANLSTAFKPKYPKLAELKAQLKESTRSLNNEMKQVAKAILRDYSAAADQERELRTEISAEKERDLAQNDASVQDATLAREVETNRELYKNVLLRMQQIQIGEQAPVTNISVVDRAAPPLRPSTPKKKRDLLISGLLALVCGIALAFILDHLDNRLKTSEEVEQYLRLPNLAVAPDFAMLHRATTSQQRFDGVRKFLLGSERATGTSPTAHEPGRGDVYRSIRTALMFSRAGAPPQKMLITSAIEGEGKTWTAVHAATAFAQTGAKTLLIDADLRRAQCHEALGADNSAGLSEVLVGQLEPGNSVRYIEDRNLFLLSAGSCVPNPAELLTSNKMLEVIRFFSEQYQYILIDSAPLMYASDTVGIATMADGVVLVAGSATPKQSVRRAAERLALAGANVLGVVLNRVDIHHPDHREYTRYYFTYEGDRRGTVAPGP